MMQNVERLDPVKAFGAANSSRVFRFSSYRLVRMLRAQQLDTLFARPSAIRLEKSPQADGRRLKSTILATELIPRRIRVNMVSPGPTETPIINRNPGMEPVEVDMFRQRMIAAVPMKRMGEADEVARAVLFLASSDASFITGVDLFVDGGCVEL